MLVVVNLSSASDVPASVLSEVDSALAGIGLRKQVRSVLIPGKAFTTTYDGAVNDRRQIESMVEPIVKPNAITCTVDVEESVSFP
jgi:hypothetical protein